MATMTRKAYAEMFGPTTGDCVRLGDTSLLAEIERDYTRYGDECMAGGGKTLRDGMAISTRTSQDGALDLMIQNAVVIDPVIGIVKGDIGVKDGKVVGIGKAGNPAIMEGVDERLVVGNATAVEAGEGKIVTPGGLDVHVHFIGAEQCHHGLATGITTLIGGGMSHPVIMVDQGSPTDIFRMLSACEAFPMNFGFLSSGSSHSAAAISELIRCGVIGVKVHEDFGAPPAVVDVCLRVADELDFQVQLHTDTLNESGFYEDTRAAIGGRTVHMYHTEGAGGGHAPDIIRCNAEPYCLPSSTNPTNPYTVNTFDEHLDMTMVGHALRPEIPEDVAHAQSRIRRQTIAAEDVLHDMGAISMLGSDSQGMGRVNEVICRTWQLASKMKDQRGRLPEERTRAGDNERIKRYIAKYTINAARTFGIDRYVGSLEPGKMADMVVWDFTHFGAKPRAVFKAGYCVWAMTGDAAACLHEVEPVVARPQWGAYGKAPQSCSATFVHGSALGYDVAGKARLAKPLLPIGPTRRLTKADMLHNDLCPEIRVNAQTFDVYVNGQLAACAPASELALTQKYFLR